jgi:hypothetical protein
MIPTEVGATPQAIFAVTRTVAGLLAACVRLVAAK